MAISHASATRDALANQIVTQIGTSGLLKIYKTSIVAGNLLVTIPLNTTAGTVSGGTITFTGTPLSATVAGAGAPGTAAVFEITTSGGTQVLNGTVGTSGQDINLSNTTLNSGDQVSLTALSYSAPT
jgi:hypothetical protein